MAELDVQAVQAFARKLLDVLTGTWACHGPSYVGVCPSWSSASIPSQ
jgi:hypothetical protein